MAQTETVPVTIPAEQQGPQTRPVEPERRLKDGDIQIEICTVDDAMTLVSGQHCENNDGTNLMNTFHVLSLFARHMDFVPAILQKPGTRKSRPHRVAQIPKE